MQRNETDRGTKRNGPFLGKRCRRATQTERTVFRTFFKRVPYMYMYVHCAAHKLNLCVAQTNSLTAVRSLFDTVTSIVNFFKIRPTDRRKLKVKLNLHLLKNGNPSFCHFVGQGGWRGLMH